MAVHSGTNGKPFTGHVTGEGFVCMGNNLVGRNVVEAMASAFKAGAGELLEERLMQTA